MLTNTLIWFAGINQPSIVGMANSSNNNQSQNAFSIFSSLTGSGSMPGSSSTNPLGIGIPSSMAGGSSQSSLIASGMGSGSVGSPGSVVNGPVRVGMNPHLGQERRTTGDVSSAFADMPQAVSKVNITLPFYFNLIIIIICYFLFTYG